MNNPFEIDKKCLSNEDSLSCFALLFLTEGGRRDDSVCLFVYSVVVTKSLPTIALLANNPPPPTRKRQTCPVATASDAIPTRAPPKTSSLTNAPQFAPDKSALNRCALDQGAPPLLLSYVTISVRHEKADHTCRIRKTRVSKKSSNTSDIEQKYALTNE